MRALGLHLSGTASFSHATLLRNSSVTVVTQRHECVHTHAQCIYAYVYSRVSNVHTITCHEGPEGGRGVALLFLQPRRLIRVDGQSHVLVALPPVKRPSTQYKRQGGPQDRSRRMRKILPPPGCRISYAL
jgi:hypothetical protein